MAGLLKPYAGVRTITQPFTGHNTAEPVGYLQPGNLRAQKGYRAGWTKYAHLHMAQDVAMPIGTDLLAPAAGLIVAEGTYTISGEHYLMLRIHKDATYQTVIFYTHIADGGLILPVGKHVTAGQHVAESGNSGWSTGPHLHWEVRVGPATADPHLSSSWLKVDPVACLVGGSLAGSSWLVPNV